MSSVVGELHGEVVVLAAHERLDGLEVVALLARHPQLVALDLGLDTLGALVADQLGDLLGVLGGDPLLERDRDLRLLARRARLTGIEDLEALLTLDQLVLEHVEHRVGAVVRRGADLDGVLALPLDGGAGALEVETGGDLSSCLTERVVDLLAVDLADDVERAVGHLDASWRFLVSGAALLFFRLAVGPPNAACSAWGDDILAGCPSGQWERTVNPSALPSKVRILHLPRRGAGVPSRGGTGPFPCSPEARRA